MGSDLVGKDLDHARVYRLRQPEALHARATRGKGSEPFL